MSCTVEIGELTGERAKYRITRPIAPGAFGRPFHAVIDEVFRAANGSLQIGQEVFIKIPQFPPSWDFEKRTEELGTLLRSFQLERICLQRLRHVRNVAHWIDVGISPLVLDPHSNIEADAFFIVQEFIKGDRLDLHLARAFPRRDDGNFHGIPEVKDFFDYSRKLIQGLCSIHRENVVHGDIWYKNIIHSGTDLYFVDFGQGLLNELILKRYNSIGGGPWAAPSGRSIRGDLFCLGCLLLYLATGKVPPRAREGDVEDDDEELKGVVARMIAAENPLLYSANQGVADLIAHCLRSDSVRESRARTADDLLRQIDLLFSVPASPVDLPELQSLLSRMTNGCNPMLRELAHGYLRDWIGMAEDIMRGSFDLFGGHDELVVGFCRLLSYLTSGDQYITISQPNFWLPRNLGIKGRFLSMNVQAAKEGAEVKRLFLLTEEDRFKPHFAEIIRAQQESVVQVTNTGVNTETPDIGSGGYYVGYRLVSEAERERIIAEGAHVGILRRGRMDLLAAGTYSDGTIVAIRFRAAAGLVETQRSLIKTWIRDSIPISAYPL